MAKFVKTACILILIVLINFFFFNIPRQTNIADSAELQITMQASQRRNMQLFYSENGEYSEHHSQTVTYDAADQRELHFEFPLTTRYLRLDTGDSAGEFWIEQIQLHTDFSEKDILAELPDLLRTENMLTIEYREGNAQIVCAGNDPYFVLDISALALEENSADYQMQENAKRKGILCIAFDLICILAFIKRRRIKEFLTAFLADKGLVLDLAKNDFKTKYAGSYLGIIWAYVQPVITIMVYWFVFQVGFRSGIVEGVPFVLWLTAGLVPWFFLSEALNSATSSLLDYSYLVKKVVFDVSIIPPVRIVSALFVHIFFCVFMMFMFGLNGLMPCIEWVQLIYYSGCLLLLILGITYMTSALVVFFRDLAQIILVVLQIGMWVTPIMWQKEMLTGKLRLIYQLNPVYYIVQGYRDALIYHKWFWESEYETVYFWAIACICLWVGTSVFRKLKVHFADVI